MRWLKIYSGRFSQQAVDDFHSAVRKDPETPMDFAGRLKTLAKAAKGYTEVTEKALADLFRIRLGEVDKTVTDKVEEYFHTTLNPTHPRSCRRSRHALLGAPTRTSAALRSSPGRLKHLRDNTTLLTQVEAHEAADQEEGEPKNQLRLSGPTRPRTLQRRQPRPTPQRHRMAGGNSGVTTTRRTRRTTPRIAGTAPTTPDPLHRPWWQQQRSSPKPWQLRRTPSPRLWREQQSGLTATGSANRATTARGSRGTGVSSATPASGKHRAWSAAAPTSSRSAGPCTQRWRTPTGPAPTPAPTPTTSGCRTASACSSATCHQPSRLHPTPDPLPRPGRHSSSLPPTLAKMYELRSHPQATCRPRTLPRPG